MTRETLPPQLRVDKERELSTLRHDLRKSKDSMERNKLEKKYKLVKFVELQKARKRLKRAEKTGVGVRAAQGDVKYILQFPAEKYISLFKEDDNESRSNGRREEIWFEINGFQRTQEEKEEEAVDEFFDHESPAAA